VNEAKKKQLVMGLTAVGQRPLRCSPMNPGTFSWKKWADRRIFRWQESTPPAKNILQLIRTCCKNAGFTTSMISAIVMGLAGAAAVGPDSYRGRSEKTRPVPEDETEYDPRRE